MLVLAAAVFLCLASGATQEQLRSRASYDPKCPENQLQIMEIDARTRGVRGCGGQVVYIESCQDQDRMNCTWVLNSPPAQQQR